MDREKLKREGYEVDNKRVLIYLGENHIMNISKSKILAIADAIRREEENRNE